MKCYCGHLESIHGWAQRNDELGCMAIDCECRKFTPKQRDSWSEADEVNFQTLLKRRQEYYGSKEKLHSLYNFFLHDRKLAERLTDYVIRHADEFRKALEPFIKSL